MVLQLAQLVLVDERLELLAEPSRLSQCYIQLKQQMANLQLVEFLLSLILRFWSVCSGYTIVHVVDKMLEALV